MRVLIVGDVHGRHEQLATLLEHARLHRGIEAAIQVGDFGFGAEALAALEAGGVRFPMPLHVIDGNHEDHRWLQRQVRRGVTTEWRQRLNLVYQARPSLAAFGATKAGFIGGALHVARPQQHGLFCGLPNYILRRHRTDAGALFARERPALVVTHSCPSGIGIGLRGSPEMELGAAEHIAAAGFDPGPREDRGESELRRLWLGLDYRPANWVFGHFHRHHDVRIDGTRFVCVSDDLTPGGDLLVWDSASGRLEMDRPV